MPVNSDNYDATLLNYEVSGLLAKREQIKTSLQQLNFESKRDFFRVILVDEASVPQIPTNAKRIKYLAAAPVGILFLVILLFLLLEIKAGRQPAEFSTARLNAEARDAPGRRIRRIQGIASSTATDLRLLMPDRLGTSASARGLAGLNADPPTVTDR